jgi:hypothetical protein
MSPLASRLHTADARPAFAGYAQPDGSSPAPPGRGRRELRDGPRFRRGSSFVLAKSGSSSESLAYSPRTSDWPPLSCGVPRRPPQWGQRAGLSCPRTPRDALAFPSRRSLVMKGSPVRVRASACRPMARSRGLLAPAGSREPRCVGGRSTQVVHEGSEAGPERGYCVGPSPSPWVDTRRPGTNRHRTATRMARPQDSRGRVDGRAD